MQKKHNESLRQTNDNQSEQIAVLDASSRKLKDELSAAKDAATNAETKVTKLGEECESLEKEKAKLEESIDSYRYSMLDEPEFYMLSLQMSIRPSVRLIKFFLRCCVLGVVCF